MAFKIVLLYKLNTDISPDKDNILLVSELFGIYTGIKRPSEGHHSDGSSSLCLYCANSYHDMADVLYLRYSEGMMESLLCCHCHVTVTSRFYIMRDPTKTETVRKTKERKYTHLSFNNKIFFYTQILF